MLVTNSATCTTPEADNEELGDLLLEVLPGDGSTIGNTPAREALSRAAGRLITAEEYEAVKTKALTLGLVVKGRGRGGSIALAEQLRINCQPKALTISSPTQKAEDSEPRSASNENEGIIINGDSIEEIKKIESSTVHCIISDIPYGIGLDDWDILHSNTNSALGGMSPAQEEAGKVFKKRGKPINGWSDADRLIPLQYYEWCMKWTNEWHRVLKPGGSVFIFAGRRFSHRCIAALEDSGFNFRDLIGWTRSRAVHRAQRLSVVYERRGDMLNARRWEGWRVGNLRPVFEPIIWAFKPYRVGGTIADNALEHGVGAYNLSAVEKYFNSADNFFHCPLESSDRGLHEAQKPVKLMECLIAMTTCEGQVILDPFAGSGTTAIAAKNLNRKFIAIEQCEKLCNIIDTRLSRPTQSRLTL